MRRDQWGYGLSTDSGEAANAQIAALGAFSRWQTDVVSHLDAAIAADPGFALPHAIKGILICTLRRPTALPKARALYERAREARPPETKREQLYLKALAAALEGRLNSAIACYEAIALACPHDLFALRQSQLELFWMGEASWMRDVTERAAPDWSPDVPGFAHFQALRAFGLEEVGDYHRAEICARSAIELDEREIWGAHAMAHVLIMQARLDEGVAWISQLGGNWQGCNHIVHHNWWHLALFHTERGDYETTLELYDKKLRDLESPLMKAMPDYFVDLQNDVSLLQRLELRGVDAGDRWTPIADLSAAWIGNPMSCFTAPQATLALSAAGRYREAGELIRALEDSLDNTNNPDLAGKTRMASLPACHAAIAFRQGDHKTVVEHLFPARRQLWHMGGSHAQRDLFYQLLCASAHHLGDLGKLGVALDEINAFGFEHMDERTSYREMIAATQTGVR